MTNQELQNKEDLLMKLLETYPDNRKINVNDFKNICSNMKLSDKQIQDIFNHIDKNKDNKLESSEIIKYFKSQEKKLRELFDSIDQDKDGKISLIELKYALRESNMESPSSNNNNITEEELVEKLIQIYDKDNNGLIDFEEWKDVLLFIPNVSLNYAVNWSMNTSASLSFLIENTIPIQLAHESSQNSKANSSKQFLNNFLSGGLAAAIARTLTAPLDRLKTLYQINFKENCKPPSIVKGLKHIIEKDGFRALFRGNFVNTLKASPDSSIKLGLFELLKDKLKSPKESEISKKMIFLAGSLSGFTSCFCVYPLDVIKVKLAASPTGTYSGILDLIGKMWFNEGGIKAFYKGFSAGSPCALLSSGMNLCFYELLRKATFKIFDKENLPIPVFMGIGALSASVTTSILYPFNFISARMIMQGSGSSNKSSSETARNKLNVVQTVLRVYGKEGALGFYKGFAPTTTKIFLGNGISFGAYEFCKKIFKQQ